MSRAGTLHLVNRGATILGTDAVGWDLPFGVIARRFKETGDNSVLWDGHKAIVEKAAFIVQQLTNLGALPTSGFRWRESRDETDRFSIGTAKPGFTVASDPVNEIPARSRLGRP